MLPTAQPFRRTTSSTRDGGSSLALTAGSISSSSSADGTSRTVSFSSPQAVGGSKGSFFAASSAASSAPSGTADGTASIGTASTAASSGMASIASSDGKVPGSESKYRRGASSYSSHAGSGSHAQHASNGAAAPMTAHNATTTTAAMMADNRSVSGGGIGANRPTAGAGAAARSGLQHYLTSVPTYRSLQQQTASVLRKKGLVGGSNAAATGTGTGASQSVDRSSSFGSASSSGAFDPQHHQHQQQNVVLPRLANLANSFHGPHPSSANGGSIASGMVAPAPSRFYNRWRRSTSGGVRRSVRAAGAGGGGGGAMTMMSPFGGAQRGIHGGGSHTSRSRRRIVLPVLVLLLIGWYAMGSGDGSGDGTGLTRRGRKKGASSLHQNSNIRAATTIGAARAEFEAGVPMPASGASTISTISKVQTQKRNSPAKTVALTHNATDLVGKRMKRQSGDDHDSSDEGVVVAKARR